MTGKTYKFGSLQDIFDQLSPDQIQRCLKDLSKIMSTAKVTLLTLNEVAQKLAEKDGKELLEKVEMKLPNPFEWTDDDADSDCKIVDPTGKELVSIKIKGEKNV